MRLSCMTAGNHHFPSFQALLQPAHIELWAVVNFSARCDTSYISRELIRCGMKKGIVCHLTIVAHDNFTALPSQFVYDCLPLKSTYICKQKIERPYTLIEEDAQIRRSNPVARVEKMFELLYAKLLDEPDFILCVLPERKNCDIYGKSSKTVSCFFMSILKNQILHYMISGPWKKKCLTEVGVVTQCISPLKINEQYLNNVLLKMNSKVID